MQIDSLPAVLTSCNLCNTPQLGRYFEVEKRDSTVFQELRAGTVCFLTVSYIIPVSGMCADVLSVVHKCSMRPCAHAAGCSAVMYENVRFPNIHLCFSLGRVEKVHEREK